MMLQLYEICLHPLSAFGTPLKGDTIFGQFCWQLFRNPELLKQKNPEKCLENYRKAPFVIFSSAFPKGPEGQYILKKPDLPSLGEESGEPDCRTRQQYIKNLKKKKWMLLSSLDNLKISDLKSDNLCNDEELSEIICKGEKEPGESFIRSRIQPHNTIHRLKNSTGTGMFAPYVMKNIFYYPGMELRLFFMTDADVMEPEKVRRGLENIGKWGYGRDASLGLGRFSVGEPHALNIQADPDADAFYSLGPCVPEKGSFSESWFTPFVRFGRHGDQRATSATPFKAPVIMADEGAVFRISDRSVLKQGYAGRAVENVSAHTETVMQGYAPLLPLHLGKTS